MSMEDEHLHLAVPVGAPDNIQGSASAPVTLIEYSDYHARSAPKPTLWRR